MANELFDVIIIGGGPAGLTAAQYAARASLATLVLDSSQADGALKLSGLIENYPGLPEPVTGRELLDRFREQAVKFGAIYRKEQVLGVKLDGEVKEVQGEADTYRGKTVIIATGSMARPADIPGEARYLGKGVSYCATCDAPFFRGLTVCVVGDGEEALKEADHLAGFARCVHLLMPGQSPEREDLAPAIQLRPFSRLLAIEGDEVVKAVRIRHLDSGREEQLETDGVFLYLHGAAPAIGFLDAAVSLGEKSCILTHESVATSVPGAYAAGDVTCAAVRQVVVSAACGCLAALEAEKYLHQRKRHRLDWAKLLGKGADSPHQ